MDETLWGLMNIVGPAILLIILLWLALRGRSRGKSGRTEQATDQLYQNEEERRRQGTDDL